MKLDFILYIGEENMNEPAFEYLNQQKSSSIQSSLTKYIAEGAPIFTCTIGLRSTHANYYLEQAEINLSLKKLKLDPVHRPHRADGRRVQSQANFHDVGTFAFSQRDKTNFFKQQYGEQQ